MKINEISQIDAKRSTAMGEECECTDCGEKFKWRKQRNRHIQKEHEANSRQTKLISPSRWATGGGKNMEAFDKQM